MTRRRWMMVGLGCASAALPVWGLALLMPSALGDMAWRAGGWATWGAMLLMVMGGWMALAMTTKEYDYGPFDESRCAGCGYALAGIDMDVCPECGGRLVPGRREGA